MAASSLRHVCAAAERCLSIDRFGQQPQLNLEPSLQIPEPKRVIAWVAATLDVHLTALVLQPHAQQVGTLSCASFVYLAPCGPYAGAAACSRCGPLQLAVMFVPLPLYSGLGTEPESTSLQATLEHKAAQHCFEWLPCCVQVVEQLQSVVRQQLRSQAQLGLLHGPVEHLLAGHSLPPPPAQSDIYSIELLDLRVF